MSGGRQPPGFHMGLFSWLSGEPPRVSVVSRVWLTDDACLAGVVRELRGHLNRDTDVLLLAHFPTTLDLFVADLEARKLPHTRFPDGMTPRQAFRAVGPGRQATVLLGLVRELACDPPPPPETRAGEGPPVVVAERHFLRRHDDVVPAFAEGFCRRTAVTFHTSLDAPLLRLFAGESVTSLLRQLGMQEDESIDSNLVGRRIGRAQDKVASALRKERDAESPEAWLRENIYGKNRKR